MRRWHTASVTRETKYGGTALILAGIVVLAINLRPAAISVGPVLSEIQSGLQMSAGTAGLLTTLPVVAFAVFGALAPRLAHSLGLHRTSLLGLLLVASGLIGRSFVDSPATFLALSVVGLSGMATANVLLPALIKLHFPDRVGPLTSIYTTAMALGLTAASMLTVPIAQMSGSWRWGLMAWGVVAAVAALPWLGLIGHDRALNVDETPISLGQIARTRLGWAMAVAFGLQSTQAYIIFGWLPEVYRDAGFSAGVAGVLLGVATGISIPLSMWLPTFASRTSNQARMFVCLIGCYAVGYLGLMLAPATTPWLWAMTIGSGASVFPVVLTLISLRARTAAGTRALSGFTQSVGYLIAAPGPWLFGALHGWSGGWQASLLAMLVVLGPLTAVLLMLSRPAYVEDQLRV